MSILDALCVDDDPETCRTVSDVLKNFGYVVSTARNGREAMQIAKDKDVRLAFLSMDMEEIDALELFSQLREVRPGAAGIFLTTLPSGPAILSADRHGVQQIIVKPVEDGDMMFLYGDPAIHP